MCRGKGVELPCLDNGGVAGEEGRGREHGRGVAAYGLRCSMHKYTPDGLLHSC